MRELSADCTRCVALCCVAPAFARSSDFAADKPAGRPCSHLLADDRCGVHDHLRDVGYPGCTVYDCFGAGQHVTQATYAGTSWRAGEVVAGEMFAAFAVARPLHELLWYVREALALRSTAPIRGALAEAFASTERLTDLPAHELVEVDVYGVRTRVNALLQDASRLARAEVEGAPDLRGVDLVGADLRTRPLRGANLRGALLVGADLRGCDLSLADLTGADLRGARVDGADLSRTLFLTQSQLVAARGDATTRLPLGRTRPFHW